MIILFNPTNEDITFTYSGRNATMKSGSKVEVPDPAGNHVLNEYGKRGLCQLLYGDKEEDVAKEGIERNLEFKKAQLVDFNERNAQREQVGLVRLFPTPWLKAVSTELGMGIHEAYTVKDEDKEALKVLKDENADLKEKYEHMCLRMEELIAATVAKNDEDKPDVKKGKK